MAKNITNPHTEMSKEEMMKSLRKDTHFETLTIDGVGGCVVCYSTQREKEKAVSLVEKIVNNSDKHGVELFMEVQKTLQAVAQEEDAELEEKNK